MPSSRIQELAHGRTRYTAEPYQRAYTELQGIILGEPPIPVASSEQAALEASVFEAIGRADLGQWPAGTSTFGIEWITGRRKEAVIKFHRASLIDILEHVLPSIGGLRRGYPSPA